MNELFGWVVFCLVIGLIFSVGGMVGDITGRSSEQSKLASALCYPEIVIDQKFPIAPQTYYGPGPTPAEYTVVTCAKSVVTITNEGVYSRVAK